jgi:4-hydroxy-tetrahydrodipicolinate synthase
MSLHKKTIFSGVATALITPFCKGAIDYDAFGSLIEHQINGGVDAILVAGTTGEGATLTMEEHRDLVAFAKEKIGGRVPLLAGCGSNATDRAVKLARRAKFEIYGKADYCNRPRDGSCKRAKYKAFYRSAIRA